MTGSKQSVSVYEIDEVLVILTFSRTDVGVWVMDPDFDVVPISTPTASLGEAVTRALDASHSPKPHPTNDEMMASWRKVLRRVGVRSTPEFNRRARVVEVSRRGEVYSFVAQESPGPRRGFVPKSDATTERTSPAAEEVGQAVFESLAQTTRAG